MPRHDWPYARFVDAFPIRTYKDFKPKHYIFERMMKYS